MTHDESLFESIHISAPRLANQIRGFGFYSKRKIHFFAIKGPRKSYERNNFEQLGCNENDAPLL